MTPHLKKTQWPVHITNALGIPAVMGSKGPWHSSGDTTDVAWFHAVCDYLGIEYPGERIRAMREIITAAGGSWDQERHSSAGEGKQAGGNVRKEAFEYLWRCLVRPGGIAEGGRARPGADDLSDETRTQEARYVYRQIRLRQGQPEFRNRLLAAYGGRCAITGDDIVPALEACHIEPHAKGGAMATSNGILLRADIHTLFDLRLLAVDTSSWRVLVHEQVRTSRAGASLQGASFRLPSAANARPSKEALDRHRERCGL